MPSDLQPITITSPPAPPPPGFFPEDMSLYKQPPINARPSAIFPSALCDRLQDTTEDLVAVRATRLRTCTPILPSQLPMSDEGLLLLWCQALLKKQRILIQLADVQLDCEELEHDVVIGLGEEAAKKTLSTIYDLGDTRSAKGRLISTISNITYKSVESLGA